MRTLVVATLLLASGLALGQPSPGSGSVPQPSERISTQVTPPLKREWNAKVLVLSGLTTGFGLSILGVVREQRAIEVLGGGLLAIGPSLGHVYAGEYGHAFGTSLLRSAALVVALQSADDLAYADRSDNWTYVALVSSAVVWAVATTYDLHDGVGAVRRYNHRQSGAVMVAPTMMPSLGGLTPGLALVGQL